MQSRDVYIVSVARTPTGGFGGTLASFTAPQLGAIAIKAAVERAQIPADAVDEVLMGNVLTANVGQNPARQAAIGAGLPVKTPCTTINKVCASGMKAVMLGAQSIMLSQNEVVVAGGMESMSNTPYYVPKARFGCRYGHQEFVDGIVQDGLWDVYNKYLMGNAAELCAKEHQVTRQEQDDFAISSYERGQAATAQGLFKDEMIPVEVPGARGKPPTIVSTDEEVSNLNREKLRAARPVFQTADGTVTAPNASTLSDGASAIVLMSGDKARELGVQVLARICGFADAAQEPERFTTSPALAVPKAIGNAGMRPDDVDFYEVNEAFAVVAVANMRLLNLDPERVNVFGGGVSLGHPLGRCVHQAHVFISSSGSRIIATLISVLKHKKGKRGVAAVCNGGGGASAIVLELV